MNAIPPLNLKPLPKPSSSPPPPQGEDKIAAKVVSFNPEAINSAKRLITDHTNKLKDTLIDELINTPPSLSFSNKEGQLAADITQHLLPSLLDNPGKFSEDLLDSINNKKAPQFLDAVKDDLVLFGKESWKTLLQDKSALKDVLAAIDQALITSDGATSNVPLLKPLIDAIGDDQSSAASPALQRKSTGAKQTLLQMAGNALKNPVVIASIALGTVEFTGVKDFTPLGANRGVNPPPAEVVSGDAMKVISEFQGKNLSESQDTIQRRIDTNLNIAKEKDPSLTLTPSAYYGNTLAPLSIIGKNQGSKVQANIKLKPDEEDKPFLLIYQEGKTSVQIIAVPLVAAREGTLQQPPNSEVTRITLPAGGTPTIKKENTDLTSLLN